MATSYTTLLGLALPATGELSGTWGDTVNNYISNYIDAAVAGTQTVNVDTTLTKTTGVSLSSTSSQYLVLLCNPASANITITAPAASKTYVVINLSATYTVKIVGAGPTTGVTLAVSERALVAWNGSDFVKIASSVVSLTTGVTGTLPVGNGGTGAATFTANNVLLGNGTSALQVVAPGTNGNVLTSNGTTWVSSTPTTQSYPGAGIANSTGSAWGTSYTTTGSGTVVALATSPSFTTPVLGTPTSGTLSNCTVDGTDAVGFRNVPQNVQTGSYTLVLADSGKHIYRGSGSAATWTIPANGSVAYAIGTAITFINLSSTSVSIAITTDTMYLSSAGTTGTRTLAQYGSATAIKIASTTWLISGSGLT
jgi:hypothetical protein